MGIFSRLGQLIKSNINELISRSEDPEKMLNQVIIDMNNQLVEARKQVAVAIADDSTPRIQVLDAIEEASTGPTSWAMPPWTRTRLSCKASRTRSGTSSGLRI